MWPWKTTGHLFYATSSFVHHFAAIGEFKLELQSGNTQFGSKSTIFYSRVTLRFEWWPWKTIGPLFSATSSFVHHFIIICEFKLEWLLKMVRIHQHAKFQTIPCMRSTGNAQKPQIFSVSLSQNSAKIRQINRPWLQSISSQGGQYTSALKIASHSLHAFSRKCQETPSLTCFTKCQSDAKKRENQQNRTKI